MPPYSWLNLPLAFYFTNTPGTCNAYSAYVSMEN